MTAYGTREGGDVSPQWEEPQEGGVEGDVVVGESFEKEVDEVGEVERGSEEKRWAGRERGGGEVAWWDAEGDEDVGKMSPSVGFEVEEEVEEEGGKRRDFHACRS